MGNGGRGDGQGSALRALRSVGAVLGGLVAVFVLTLATDQVMHSLAIYPPWGEPMLGTGLNLLALAYRIAYGVVGGYVAAALAPRAPLAHALAVGAVGVVLSTAGAFAAWGLSPAWFLVALVLVSLPAAWAGGRIRVAGRAAR